MQIRVQLALTQMIEESASGSSQPLRAGLLGNLAGNEVDDFAFDVPHSSGLERRHHALFCCLLEDQ